VPGGTFNRLNDPAFPATVSSFDLGLFEVTVGRFRAFVEAYPGSKPKPGDGAHPLIPDSGWQGEWEGRLPATQSELLANLVADGVGESCNMWSDSPGSHEDAPMGCVTWYEAFAFCAWDGGRLPTLAEWQFAYAGGDEQRSYPWGFEAYDETRAVYGDAEEGALIPVGSKPAGRSRWGQFDLGGSRTELLADFVGEDSRDLPTPCVDCVDRMPEHSEYRVGRDANFEVVDPVSDLDNGSLRIMPTILFRSVGVRCAYDP